MASLYSIEGSSYCECSLNKPKLIGRQGVPVVRNVIRAWNFAQALKTYIMSRFKMPPYYASSGMTEKNTTLGDQLD